MKKKSLTTNLIEGLNKEISSKDRYRASLHILDWIGCAFIGSTAHVGKIFIDFSKNYAKGRCNILNGDSNNSFLKVFKNLNSQITLKLDKFYSVRGMFSSCDLQNKR